MLCNLLLGEINKFEFQLFLQKKLWKLQMAIDFAYDVEKTYNLSKSSSHRGDKDFNGLRPFGIFLESQNSKGRYESKKILGFYQNMRIFDYFYYFEFLLLFRLFFNYSEILVLFWFFGYFFSFLNFFVFKKIKFLK